LDLWWFNQSWPARKFEEGQEVAAFGKVGARGGRLQMQNPAVEVLRGSGADQVHTRRIIPVHPVGEGVSTGVVRRLAYDALRRLPELEDPLPEDVRARHDLPPFPEALHDIHFPEHPIAEQRARWRLKFDELFFLELGVAFRKHRIEAETEGIAHDLSGDLAERFVASLPFDVTGAQRRAMDEVAKDMAAAKPMNRLLQGDVGSGKTVVALHACLVAIGSGHQAAIMAPTEVLAGQHLRTVASLLDAIGARRLDAASTSPQASLLDAPAAKGPSYALLTAAVTGKDRQTIVEAAASGGLALLIGTHALVQEHVELADLGVAVID
ncbi:MAG TPA: DEAD/DEAH box helicase, partial [Actinomycetota bacterium]|nr:DEAD/DEAH box helicase [Actinomycetota bacterium]